MGNLWIFYSLWGLFLLGLGDFIKKVVIHKGVTKEVFIFCCFLFYLIFLGINFYFKGSIFFSIDLIISATIIGFFDAVAPLGMLAALKYLSSSFVLIFIRLISSISIFFIGIYLLGDALTFFNIFGFVLGIIAIFLLSGYSVTNKNSMNQKGIIALSGSTIAIICSHSYFKYVVAGIDVNNFMIIKFLISFCFILIYLLVRKKFKLFSYKQIKLALPFAFFNGIIFVLLFLYALPNMYLLGPISLSYKILSYSLVIPIILSIIFYNKEVTFKKSLAFFLTCVSLFLFL